MWHIQSNDREKERKRNQIKLTMTTAGLSGAPIFPIKNLILQTKSCIHIIFTFTVALEATNHLRILNFLHKEAILKLKAQPFSLEAAKW